MFSLHSHSLIQDGLPSPSIIFSLAFATAHYKIPPKELPHVILCSAHYPQDNLWKDVKCKGLKCPLWSTSNNRLPSRSTQNKILLQADSYEKVQEQPRATPFFKKSELSFLCLGQFYNDHSRIIQMDKALERLDLTSKIK